MSVDSAMSDLREGVLGTDMTWNDKRRSLMLFICYCLITRRYCMFTELISPACTMKKREIPRGGLSSYSPISHLAPSFLFSLYAPFSYTEFIHNKYTLIDTNEYKCGLVFTFFLNWLLF